MKTKGIFGNFEENRGVSEEGFPKGLKVKKVIDRWYGKDHVYVKVVGEGGEVWILRKGKEEGWRIVLYEAPEAKDLQDQLPLLGKRRKKGKEGKTVLH